jgi:hypothetical protein
MKHVNLRVVEFLAPVARLPFSQFFQELGCLAQGLFHDETGVYR